MTKIDPREIKEIQNELDIIIFRHPEVMKKEPFIGVPLETARDAARELYDRVNEGRDKPQPAPEVK